MEYGKWESSECQFENEYGNRGILGSRLLVHGMATMTVVQGEVYPGWCSQGGLCQGVLGHASQY